MRVDSIKSGRTIVAIAVLALLAAACGGGARHHGARGVGRSRRPPRRPLPRRPPRSRRQPPGSRWSVCELAYYTGAFAAYGKSLTNDVRFPIEEVINLDPPLGRTWELRLRGHRGRPGGPGGQDLPRAVRAEILVSIAHQYRTYRDYMMEYWQENDSPLGPSVHGGAIPGNLGGKAAEPIFRAQGLDEALGTYGSLYAESIGAKNIVIFATQVEGFQLAADAAEKAATILGLNVLARLDVPADAALLPGRGPEDRRPEARRRHRPGGIDGVRHADQGRRPRPACRSTGSARPGGARRSSSRRWAPTRSPRRRRSASPSFAPNKTTPAWAFFQPLWDAAAARRGLRRDGPVRLLDLRPHGPDGPGRRDGRFVQGERLGAGHVQGRRPAGRGVLHVRRLPEADPRRQGHRLRGRHRPRHCTPTAASTPSPRRTSRSRRTGRPASPCSSMPRRGWSSSTRS